MDGGIALSRSMKLDFRPRLRKVGIAREIHRDESSIVWYIRGVTRSVKLDQNAIFFGR